jgi:uncharacterized Zn finger protein
MSWYREWKPYVPVAKRRAKAAAYAAKLAKKEKRTLCPVTARGRKMCESFWGQAWCENLERYSDFENRLPRGRTYARNGSVIDLQIDRGRVRALVSGSEVYRISIAIKTLSRPAWKQIKHDCSQSISSLIDLLQGRFDQGVMQRLTQRDGGLFPQPDEIEMSCSCPDWAGLCKHVAAVMYCVGARLDAAPELLFTLRDVDHLELTSQAVAAENLDRTLASDHAGALEGKDLGEIFGIELDANAGPPVKPAPVTSARRKRIAAARAGIEAATAVTVVDTNPNDSAIVRPSKRRKTTAAAHDNPRTAKRTVKTRAKRTIAGRPSGSRPHAAPK